MTVAPSFSLTSIGISPERELAITFTLARPRRGVVGWPC
jgi:hypothetical protein